MLLSLMGFNNIDNKMRKSRGRIFYNIVLLLVLVFLIVNTINIIEVNKVLDRIRNEDINYDLFRKMNISDELMADILNLDEVRGVNDLHYNGYDILTLYMLVYNYSTFDAKKISHRNIDLFLNSLVYDKDFRQLKYYYFTVFNDIESFPVIQTQASKSSVSFEDSWNAPRSYGGDRGHEGTDLMGRENTRGLYKILSMTKGTVEQKGWLEQGGYRIGIRSEGGAYFYYAHLDSYADNIKVGDQVEAGQFIGYMGDSGYGPEGTRGQFDVHLHLGIYLEAPFGEVSINPYYILKYMEDNVKG